jgi:hypothetical protein
MEPVLPMCSGRPAAWLYGTASADDERSVADRPPQCLYLQPSAVATYSNGHNGVRLFIKRKSSLTVSAWETLRYRQGASCDALRHYSEHKVSHVVSRLKPRLSIGIVHRAQALRAISHQLALPHAH